MLPEGVQVRPMEESDIEPVLAIIEDHDEDDAEAARYSYEESGLADQFVLVENDNIIGVTGFYNDEGTEGTCTLSWTYLSHDKQGSGYGKQILESLIDHLKEIGVRKVFVTTSDYVDEEDGDIYAAARAAYEAVGFREEIRHPNYYAEGETQIIYGLPLKEVDSARQVEDDDSLVYFNGFYPITETEDAYYLQWDVKKKKLFGGKEKQFSVGDLEIAIKSGQEANARSIYVSFPSNIPSVVPPLNEAEFFEEGRLKNFYEDGVDEVHYRYNL